jgi:hypothetical protein
MTFLDISMRKKLEAGSSKREGRNSLATSSCQLLAFVVNPAVAAKVALAEGAATSHKLA